jgi:hypothetical protein
MIMGLLGPWPPSKPMITTAGAGTGADGPARNVHCPGQARCPGQW